MRMLIAISTLCAILVVSCGGDDDSTVPSASPTAGATSVAATATPLAEATAVEDIEATPGLKPADSETPAAGTCLGPTTEDVVTVELFGDIPSPRCSYVTPDQRIRFVNHTEELVTLTLGRYGATVAANSSVLFDAPAGSYLALGVHVVDASVPSARAELWLQETQ